MVKENFKHSVISSLFWKFLERSGTQVIQFIVQIILARMLLPKHFGLIAIIVIFTNIAGIFVQSGFSTALIQKKETDETDFSSVFYMNLVLSIILYFILFFTAPVISDFFHEHELTSLLRVLSLVLFFGAINSIQNAVISKKMHFRNLFYSSLGAIIVSGSIGILMAYKGYGVWALVINYLVNSFMVTTIMWFTVKWRPKMIFSFKRVTSLFKYGWKILVTSLIYSFYNDLRSLVIGKMHTSEMLGFYNRGTQFPSLIVTNIDGSMSSVLLPALSLQQDDIQKVKALVRRAVISSTFILFPLMFGLAVIAKPLVIILITDKWLPSVPYLQIFCFVYAIWPIHTVNLQAINAIGRSDVSLKLQIIKRSLDLGILAVTVFWGVYAIAVGALVSGILTSFINAYPNKRLINYSYHEQIKDILPSLLLSASLSLVVMIVSFIKMPLFLELIVKVIFGGVFYLAMAHLFKVEAYTYLVSTIKDLIRKRQM